MYDVELSNAIARHLEKEDAAERRRHHCTKCGGAIWEDTALPCSNGELICQSCAEDFRVDEDDSPDYECSICGDTGFSSKASTFARSISKSCLLMLSRTIESGSPRNI